MQCPKVIAGVLIGCSIGFLSQFATDFVSYRFNNGSCAVKFSRTPCEFIFLDPPEEKHLGETMTGWLTCWIGDDEKLRSQARPLLLQLMFLRWLKERGSDASRSAAIGGLLAALIVIRPKTVVRRLWAFYARNANKT